MCVPKNNSKANTHLVAIAEVKDSKKYANNFKELKNQIHALQNFARRQKRLLSSSLETMLSCPMAFQERQGHSVPVLSRFQTESKEPTKKRALQSLQQFLESGGKTNAVKCFNNKLRHPFLEAKIANIAPPYLYILLGITLKHPNLIHKEVQNRDEITAKQKHSNYRRNWLKAEEKKKQIVLSKGTLY